MIIKEFHKAGSDYRDVSAALSGARSLLSASGEVRRCVIDQLFIAYLFTAELLPVNTAQLRLLISSHIDCDSLSLSVAADSVHVLHQDLLVLPQQPSISG